MNSEEASRIALELGLERLYELDSEAFARGIEAGRALAARIPGPRSLADEPAHVCLLPDRSRGRRGE